MTAPIAKSSGQRTALELFQGIHFFDSFIKVQTQAIRRNNSLRKWAILFVLLLITLCSTCYWRTKPKLFNVNARGYSFNLRISDRDIIVTPIGIHAGNRIEKVAVPPAVAVQRTYDLRQTGNWRSAIRKMTIVGNPRLFFDKILVPKTLVATPVDATMPEAVSTIEYGPDNLTSGSFQMGLNKDLITALGLDKTLGSHSAVIHYLAKTSRIDTLTVNDRGELNLRLGSATDLAPSPGKISKLETALANIYAEPDNRSLDDSVILPINNLSHEKNAISSSEGCLKKVCQKLAAGAPIKIVFYGDSITCGASVEDPNLAFPKLFVNELRKRYPASAITATNKGLSGTSTESRIKQFGHEVLAEHPDLLIVEFVNNFALSKDQNEHDFNVILTEAKETRY